MRLCTTLFVLTWLGCAATPEGPDASASDPNAATFIVGASFDRSGDGAALGANYEYRKRGMVGLGGYADVAFGRSTSTVLGGAGFFHPAERWTVFAGPGVEFVRDDAEFLVRIGGSYAFPMDELTLSPIGWLDLAEGDVALLLGLGFGIRF
jgi:hypothetical protein